MAAELKNVSGIDVLVNEMVTNIGTIREEVVKEFEPLVSIATTPENLKDRKKDKAAINKKKKEINSERIAFEKTWKSAVDPVSDAYKAIDELLTGYEKAINAKLDDFEIQRVEQKQSLIKQVFDSIPIRNECEGWIMLADIYNPKWENVTYKESQIRDDITILFNHLSLSYDTIVGMHHKYEKEGLQALKDTLDIQVAIERMNSLADQERNIEERRKGCFFREALNDIESALAPKEEPKEPEKDFEELNFFDLAPAEDDTTTLFDFEKVVNAVIKLPVSRMDEFEIWCRERNIEWHYE